MLSDILGRLEGHGVRPAGSDRWMAKCPAHEDGKASLQVTRGTGGNTLLVCFAGCKLEAIVDALGMTVGDLFERDERKQAKESLPEHQWKLTATYTYQNAAGEPLYRVLRRVSHDSGKKTFRQERRDGDVWRGGMDGVARVLYRLPQLSDRETADDLVFVVEGEKDADNLAELGAIATTNVGGAGKWLPQYTEQLRGRHVVILPDNDPPGEEHAKVVAKALDGHSASVRLLALPGLPYKGDVTDWIGSGGTLEQLRALAASVSTGACFAASSQRVQGEAADRVQLGKHILTFGVKFLDEALGGITRRDLVLVGAKTGVGKTQCATNTALANCRAGRRVHYFALEAEDMEIERRMKFQIIAAMYYRQYSAGHRIRYLDWYLGRLEHVVGHLDKRATEELGELVKNLRTYYRVDNFTGDDFAKHLAAIQDETDLVILDHFHYVDTDDKDENRGQKRVIKQIRDSALRAGRPVLVVGHVRKSDPRNAPLVPTEEAFHGSSDLVKIATKAIMIAPDYDTRSDDRSRWPTYMQIAKCRQDSSLTRHVARIVYDTRAESYETRYLLGRLTDGGKTFEQLAPVDVPDWARSASNAPID